MASSDSDSDSSSPGRAEPNALASASSLVLLQAGSRLSTFALNQALVRLATPTAYGVAAIQFELLSSTILFLAREGIRSAVLRAPASADPTRLANVARLPLILSPLLAAACVTVYYRFAPAETTGQPGFTNALMVYVFAAMIELRVEPAHLAALRTRGVGLRVKAEGWGVAAKSVTTFVVLAVLSRLRSQGLDLLAFALGQLAYAGAVQSVYRSAQEWTMWRLQVIELEEKRAMKRYFDRDTLRLGWEMTAQSLVKHFLTEGDKFLISIFAPLQDQGGYALAANYGSLVARILFQPLEETARLFFSRTVGSTSPSTSTNNGKTPSSPQTLKRAASLLTALVLLYTHLALLLGAFVPPYLPLLCRLVLPRRFLASTAAPAILRAYIFSLPVMGLNGALEALVASAASAPTLRAQSGWMGFCSFSFLVCAVFLRRGWTNPGTEVVWANTLALGLRAAWAARFAKDLLGPELRWRRALPTPPVALAFAFAGWVARIAAPVAVDSIREQVRHVAIGVLCVGMCAVVCVLCEEDTLRAVVIMVGRRRD
ncbi:Rft-1-domain-containing protein [Exidia glandulosa HHB12029]|uniref:Man(5)GlcNAc(2)-PP-dolichol translocation protein RFT1 n=1 Tax=Exidia glandulosa HHB12029 TaxID=1314781 RepID=A0A166MSW5_EXIGL|nr:Rft-1-domain-containing protein [Exidia glandulosa HHB12029]